MVLQILSGLGQQTWATRGSGNGWTQPWFNPLISTGAILGALATTAASLTGIIPDIGPTVAAVPEGPSFARSARLHILPQPMDFDTERQFWN